MTTTEIIVTILGALGGLGGISALSNHSSLSNKMEIVRLSQTL